MSDRELPSGLVTFWFSDIEGSTRVLQELGHDAYTSVLERHNEILADIVGTSLVSTEGDSYFCVFASPFDAVSAATTAQTQIETHPWPDGGRIRIRIGMHTGPARLGGADFVGLDVHRAARISAAGHGGQVLISEATKTLVDHELPEGTVLVDLGEHLLKDLQRPERLFQLNVEGLQDSFPPVASKTGGVVRLPEPVTKFVGRSTELAEVTAALSQSRLVTLVGMGGVGKTRLALQAASRGDFRGHTSVYFIGLADSTAASSVAKAASTAIGLSEQAGRPIEETLVEYQRERGDLLIFDNCEHVVDEVASLTESLLRDCPDVQILATSREPLLVEGERVVALAPMRTEEVGDEGAGSPNDAVRLFIVRAAAVSPEFDPSLWESEIGAICRRLEGIPLAIELAAARIPVLTPAEILEHLQNRFSLLTTRRRGATPRHQTLEATLDWSYELLDSELRELLARLSVFRGGFSIEAVERVCFEDPEAPAPVLDALATLHERSLLQREIVSGRTRFHLLDTVREYAQRKLAAEHGEESTLARHRNYFLDYVRTQTLLLGGGDQLEALQLLEADHDNVRDVLDRAVAENDLELAADLAGRLAWFWYVHGHFMEGETRAENLLSSIPADPDRPWLRLLTASAQFDYRLGQHERAAAKLRQAIGASKRTGERRLEMWGRAYAATNEIFRMEVDEGQRQAEKALALAEEEGDLLAIGYVRMIQIGGAAARLESQSALSAETATQLKTELAPLAQLALTLGERNIIGHVMEVEGVLSFRSGDRSGAALALDRSIVALTELRTIGCACHCLEAIAWCVGEAGMEEPALKLLGASDGLRDDVGIEVSPMEEPFRQRTNDRIAESWSLDAMWATRESGVGLSIQEAMQFARDVLARF